MRTLVQIQYQIGNEVMEINVTKEYDNTIKSEIIVEDIKSKVTDFNLENNQIDHLNLDIDIIKDPAKWPVINDKIKLLLVKNNPIQINLNYYPLESLDDSKKSFLIFSTLRHYLTEKS